MREELEVLAQVREEYVAQARHHELQRATVANLLVGMAGAILAVLGHLRFDASALPLAVFLMLIGVYGVLISAKLYERLRRALTHAKLFHAKLDEMCGGVELLQIKRAAMKEHDCDFPRMSKRSLHWLWHWLFIGIALLGLASTLAVVCKQSLS